MANSEEADELGGKGSRLGRSVLSHVATEQRRRDKINEGCVPSCVGFDNLLLVLLMPTAGHVVLWFLCSHSLTKAFAYLFDPCVSRFLALRELIPHKDKMDKATFLQQAVEYIRQLQVCE